ncbi:MAG: hypothetical protein FJY73_04340 [Candidatus Eisenbacteria bacterium]|nr:hypothetical protein [Candidatus Eisenbacteria bacterium]
MTHRKRNILITLVLVLPAVLLLAFGREAPPVRADQVELHLELVPEPGKTTQGIPGNCTTWHEIYPAYCTPHHQSGYEDNGDGEVSPCDIIELNGIRYHIIWAGPTYWLNCSGFETALEPIDPRPGNPTCEIWHTIYPPSQYCQESHVDNWQDNGDGVVSACDYVWISGHPCHIVDVRLNITVVPDGGGTATEQGSWGKVKGLFRKVL